MDATRTEDQRKPAFGEEIAALFTVSSEKLEARQQLAEHLLTKPPDADAFADPLVLQLLARMLGSTAGDLLAALERI